MSVLVNVEAKRRSLPLHLLLLAALAAMALPAGCARSSDDEPAAKASQEGRYAITGTIVSVAPERSTLLVDHEEIPGYMPAMTMEFRVSPGDLANARPGLKIRGTMYQAADGFHLEEVWPQDDAATRIVDEASRLLRQDTVTRGRSAYREVGENLPDFALYDQTGAAVQAARFHGRQIALNFIFTRCPDATMCPAATMRMIQLQEMAREAGVDNFQIISITLDPEYDTPGVLRQYAEQRGIDTSNFSFLTGPEQAIKDLMTQLGVLAFQDGPLISHTATTVLIDANGRIIHRVDGKQWDPSDFARRLHKAGGKADS